MNAWKKLEKFIIHGGHISEPEYNDNEWELGWNMGPAYCVLARHEHLKDASRMLNEKDLDEMARRNK